MILFKAEAEQKKLAELKQKDASRGREAEEKLAWRKVLTKAEGGKVYDNPALVKKKIKRIEKQKQKSSEAWYATWLRHFA